MARKRDRAFALTLAVLFFITAFGFTFLVIWEQVHGNSNSNNTSSNTSSQNTSNTQSCTESASIASSAMATPAVYKASGTVKSLQTTDLTVGTGQAAKDGDCLQVKYYGTLAQSGKEFDENYDKATAFQFQLGKGEVIQGWDQGVVGMKVGGVRRIAIPSSLGYGSQGSGAIPANSDLVFVVKLLNIVTQ